MSPNAHSSTTYNSLVLETAYVPSSKWVDQKAVVHLHNGILQSREKEGTLTFYENMNITEEYYAK